MSQLLGKVAASNVVHDFGAEGLQMHGIYLMTLAQLVFSKLFHRRQFGFGYFFTQSNEMS